MKWYKRDPEAFAGGTAELSLEEVGAYTRIIDLIYSRDGYVPDDERFLARALRCDVRVWRRIKQRLIETGKISTSGGLVANLRATSEISYAQVRMKKGGKPNKNNGANLTDTLPRARVTTTVREVRKEDRAIVGRECEGGDLFEAPAEAPPSPAPNEFATFYEKYPNKVGKPKAKEQFAKARKRASMDDIMAGLARYVAKTDDRAWCNPATWLHQDRWADQPGQSRNTNGGGNGHGRRSGSLLDVIEDTIEHTGGYETGYVPGTEGPRPLELDQPKSPPGLRLIPKR